MKTSSRRWILWLAPLLLAGSVGWLVAAEAKPFLHAFHLKQGVGCADCHDAAAEGEGLDPKEASCANCHDKPMLGAPLPGHFRDLKAKFPHRRHAAALKCADCHQAVETDAFPDRKPVMEAERCFACHAENGLDLPEKACAVCHGRDERKEAPADHSAVWMKRHGQEAEARVFEDHGKECSLCHTQGSCQSCHRTTRPASHNGAWRMRLHGQAAEWDRDTCKTCHETGSCQLCHRTTRPLNHTGAWNFVHGRAAGSLDRNNCRVCHNESSCAHCHSQPR